MMGVSSGLNTPCCSLLCADPSGQTTALDVSSRHRIATLGQENRSHRNVGPRDHQIGPEETLAVSSRASCHMSLAAFTPDGTVGVSGATVHHQPSACFKHN
eukprot:906090-Rhodomonas_salina.1